MAAICRAVLRLLAAHPELHVVYPVHMSPRVRQVVFPLLGRHERVSLVNVGPQERLYNEVAAWAKDAKMADGSRVIDQAWVKLNLARFKAKLEVLRLMNWKQAWCMTQGALHPADSSAAKVFGSEFYIEGYRLMLEVLGANAPLLDDAPGAALRGRVDRSYRNGLILTFGGGTNEVQRDIIAMAGLGMPHYKE